MWECVPPRSAWLPRFALAVLRRLVLTVRSFVQEGISYKALALTYSTLFSTVPLLAIVFAIAKGFGLNVLIEEKIKESFASQPETVDTLINFANSYLEHTQGGVFLGVGILLLLWTLLSLTDSIEKVFNQIWQVTRERSTFRKMTDYTAVLFLLPVLAVVTSGLSIFVSTFIERLPDILLLRPAALSAVKLLPYALMCLLFTGMYAFMPNTKVKTASAFAGGLPAGIAFQALQFFYIHSQVWLSSYNAIYGSFAALPLFLLWCRLSWFICLFGATLSYVDQNIDNFYYGKNIPRTSRRYHDFLCLKLAAIACRRFVEKRSPYTAEKIARLAQVPIRLATDILFELCRMNILIEVSNDEKGDASLYLPACDVHQITIRTVLAALDAAGSTLDQEHLEENDRNWHEYMNFRESMFDSEFADRPLHVLEMAVKK